uniref:Fish-egg lectin n=1 Tax=Leptobrachium leishanense TaxID=445787 RepID=A0A8C5RA62_9ANUR
WLGRNWPPGFYILYRCSFIYCFFILPGQHCSLITGWLKQIDAGAGEVFGVNGYDDIFRLVGDDWVQFPGKLKHVTVGPSGLWGANNDNYIFKIQDAKWVNVEGKLKQLDAGGNGLLVGVNQHDNIFCLNQDSISSTSANLPFNDVEGSLKYYSCGLYGCWGVNSKNEIFHRLDVSPTNCKGSEWKPVEGNLVMVEAGTDGSVYGLNGLGQIYRRQGISSSNPMGTNWKIVNINGPYKHLSYDEGILWLINTDGNIFKCDLHQ